MMDSTIIQPSIGDVLEALRPDELRLAPSIAYAESRPGPRGIQALAVDGGPTNQQIIDATKGFYNKNTRLVDTSAVNTGKVSQQQPNFVKTMNSYDWKDQRLTQERTNTVDNGLGIGASGKGIFDDALDQVDATKIFSTIGIGVSVDVQMFVGGAGGLGAVFDIAKREPAKGYGYATGEAGLRFAVEFNVQLLLLNQLPHELDEWIYGLKVSISPGYSLSFQVFYRPPGLTLLGYAIGAGVGVGGGATVFGGHIWHFG
jgi:hypothetical protein